MPEALEAWPVPMIEKILPRHLQIIYEINYRFLKDVAIQFPGDNDRLRRMSIVEESEPKKIRMGNLSVVGSHSVNGVSELHSQLLVTNLFGDFYELWPDKFTNVTNGITQRRWLMKANVKLSELITDAIGDAWTTDLNKLDALLPLRDDAAFKKKWAAVKRQNKMELAAYVKKATGAVIDPDSMLDVQVKRIHEYKRQLLFAFYMLSQYLDLKANPKADILPRTFIVSGKAAPGYYMAKLIIRFVNAVAEIVNKDRSINDRLKVIFLENYRVSLAERIFPASDLSEQISTAGTEASGTGCMKFMVNGAVTIGTLDGANIEIAKAVGKDNIFTFGLKADEILAMRMNGYRPYEYIERSPVLSEIFRLIQSNFLSPIDFGLFNPIAQSLLGGDYFFVCADFEDYCRKQDEVSGAYRDADKWLRRSITNVAKSGHFSSDRAIAEYAKKIWGVPVRRNGKS
jgi:starch phosphorylase